MSSPGFVVSDAPVADPVTAGLGAGASETRAVSLAGALAQVGIPCRIDVHGAAAFLLAADDALAVRLADHALRRDVLALGRRHGFTHVAVIVGDR